MLRQIVKRAHKSATLALLAPVSLFVFGAVLTLALRRADLGLRRGRLGFGGVLVDV